MYNETLNTKNKIISNEDISNIFSRLNEVLKTYNTKADKEKQLYDSLSWENQLNMKREYAHFYSDQSFSVDFYDSTTIRFDTYEGFITAFNNRLSEIRSINSHFTISYFDVENKSCNNSINLIIYEDSFEISISLDSANSDMSEIFNYIKKIINDSPERYDNVIKNKTKICFTYTTALGLIIGIILSLVLVFIPPIFEMMVNGLWFLFPICSIMFGIFMGTLIFSSSINRLYNSIDMKLIYDGYDHNKHEAKYKYDKQSYVDKSEVIIGKNSDNLTCRDKIIKMYNDKKKYLIYELFAIVIITLVLVVIQIIGNM